jgi:hypothetical protein
MVTSAEDSVTGELNALQLSMKFVPIDITVLGSVTGRLKRSQPRKKQYPIVCSEPDSVSVVLNELQFAIK